MFNFVSIALLGLLKNTEAAGVPDPMSAWDSGSQSILLYLRRDDDDDKYNPFRSTDAKFGHYYYPVSIGGNDFNLQVSSYGTKTAVAGKECRMACKTPNHYDHGDKKYSGEVIQNFFKTFNSTEPETGFFQSAFTGRYINDIVMAHGDKDRTAAVRSFRTYIMFAPMSSNRIEYESGQDGYIGLGPYTTDNDNEKEDSYMYQLVKGGVISKNIVTYNITFNANAQQGSQSYVQLGDISMELQHNVDWIVTQDWDYWKSPVGVAYFRTSNKMYPFTEFQANAIFDPQVDYMYVNQIEFDQFMQPILMTVYGDALTCTDNNCYFETSCDKVVRKDLGLYFSIQAIGKHYYQVQVQLEDYLIDAVKQWGKEDDACYLPLFVVDPGMSVDAFTTWYLGNMFMDRYLIVHDMENADDVGGKYKPRIGLYDKHQTNGQDSEETVLSFLQ